MTTYIADGYGAGCDSLWTDNDGNHANSIPIRKYLWFDGSLIDGQLSRQRLVLYSGDFYALLNHQAHFLNIIDDETYHNNLIHLEAKECDRISLVEIDAELFPFDITPLKAEFESGVYFEGTGGLCAANHYIQNHKIRPAIQHAINLDPKSGPEINSLYFAPDGELDLQGFDAISHDMCDTIKREVEQMASGFEQNEAMGGCMKYAGYSTSPSQEAKRVSAKEMIEFEEKRRKERRIAKTPEGSVRRKRIIRQVATA